VRTNTLLIFDLIHGICEAGDSERGRVMSGKKFISACIGASISLATAWHGSVAFARDLTPPAPPPGSDIHGFVDVTFANDYITPRGLLVTNSGLTTQVLNGLVFDIYKNPMNYISGVSIFAGTWNDLWSKQDDPHVGSWNEFDWFFGGTVTFARAWKVSVQYIVFESPPGHFSQERNVETQIAFDDGALTRSPLTINPYVKWFYAVSGDSTVVVGNKGRTYDVEIGMIPRYDLKPYYRIPLAVYAPTWITVGPTSYWNRGVTGCGLDPTTPCSLSHAGVFTTGLTAKLGLDAYIPARWGNWYVKGGFQYYYLINDSLLLAQTFTGTASAYVNAHRDVWVGFGGLGFTF
jgi:hypothetical protein